ncbi:hypothetical protein FKP32DRAFT_1588817 [Trametes sanguinea]|nr:hypothetical protein FKP32DRAFT_1588817 [Trametes sanguinea]
MSFYIYRGSVPPFADLFPAPLHTRRPTPLTLHSLPPERSPPDEPAPRGGPGRSPRHHRARRSARRCGRARVPAPAHETETESAAAL